MISALVLCGPGESGARSLVTTLSALVPGVAEGLIGDAVVLTRGGERVAAVADAAGATLVALAPGTAPFPLGAAHARGTWCLCLDAGDVPGEGWLRALERFTDRAPPVPFGRLQRRSQGLAGAALRLRDRLAPPRGVRAGDLVLRQTLLDGTGSRPAPIPVSIERDGG